MLSDQGWNGLSGLSPAPFPNDVLIHKRLPSPPLSPVAYMLDWNLDSKREDTLRNAKRKTLDDGSESAVYAILQSTRVPPACNLDRVRDDCPFTVEKFRGAFRAVPGFLAPARTVSASVIMPISVVIMIVRSPPSPSFLHASPPASRIARSIVPSLRTLCNPVYDSTCKSLAPTSTRRAATYPGPHSPSSSHPTCSMNRYMSLRMGYTCASRCRRRRGAFVSGSGHLLADRNSDAVDLQATRVRIPTFRVRFALLRCQPPPPSPWPPAYWLRHRNSSLGSRRVVRAAPIDGMRHCLPLTRGLVFNTARSPLLDGIDSGYTAATWDTSRCLYTFQTVLCIRIHRLLVAPEGMWPMTMLPTFNAPVATAAAFRLEDTSSEGLELLLRVVQELRIRFENAGFHVRNSRRHRHPDLVPPSLWTGVSFRINVQPAQHLSPAASAVWIQVSPNPIDACGVELALASDDAYSSQTPLLAWALVSTFGDWWRVSVRVGGWWGSSEASDAIAFVLQTVFGVSGTGVLVLNANAMSPQLVVSAVGGSPPCVGLLSSSYHLSNAGACGSSACTGSMEHLPPLPDCLASTGVLGAVPVAQRRGHLASVPVLPPSATVRSTPAPPATPPCLSKLPRPASPLFLLVVCSMCLDVDAVMLAIPHLSIDKGVRVSTKETCCWW
ncbi:hypothetical protein R3P38DRAFT_3212064 [Favolaschia claudopus]|uniref:Uncharacterized protein n=1 Tax=Favolaschia claudopus TaxID=2862362 RepID=A0AAW0AF96_9AGAR